MDYYVLGRQSRKQPASGSARSSVLRPAGSTKSSTRNSRTSSASSQGKSQAPSAQKKKKIIGVLQMKNKKKVNEIHKELNKPIMPYSQSFKSEIRNSITSEHSQNEDGDSYQPVEAKLVGDPAETSYADSNIVVNPQNKSDQIDEIYRQSIS